METRQQMKYSKLTQLILMGAFACLLIGCSKDKTGDGGSTNTSARPSQYPGTEAGAKALLSEFMKTGADYAALTKPLQPTSADYQVLFEGDFAKKAEATYAQAWNKGEMVVARKPEQTELKLWSATSEDLKQWNEKAQPFPGGYKDVAANFKDGVTIYRFKFVEPGKDLGMAYDGLAYVNGQWRIFPKPWRIGK